MATQAVSKQTQKNWWIDAAVFGGAVVASLSGVYFLFAPSGGFQGGRNPNYAQQILFTRQTWDNLHTWGGVLMILAALVHLAIHWNWVTAMLRKAWRELTGKPGLLNARGRWNLVLDLVVGVSFLLAALSGAYFLYFPGGRRAIDPLLLFPRQTWDLVHTWAGVVLVLAGVIHFAIHWKWVVKVTRRMVGLPASARPAEARPAPAAQA